MSKKTESTGFAGYIVALGASAGGLDALERLFDKLVPGGEAAYVVIQHLSPDHKSMMDNLLGRHTRMPVITAENDMEIRPNHVFLIPPGKNMTVEGNRLRLAPKPPHGLSLPIDLFFTSLAKEFGNRSIGVILSGTGSDGTRGAVAINDAGGLLLAQEPGSAKFDGMPRSVIATGLVDDVLAPEELAQRLIGYIDEAPAPRPRSDRPPVEERATILEEILHLLQQRGGVDFRAYKPATVLRRIERRMQVHHIRTLDAYLDLLRREPGEPGTLRREILIPVTSFFRDGDAYEALSTTTIAALVRDHSPTQPIRAWVAACSTGEEAYSLAILFAEAFEQVKRWPNLKIFATDVEQHYLDAASSGSFSEAIAGEVSPERLERYFTRKGGRYLIKNEIRQYIIFARHNLLEDPPFTRMDLVSCRNALIYLQPPAQEKAMRRLQYALAPNGYLFLGSSESLGVVQRDFTVVSSKHKVYKILRPAVIPLDHAGLGTPTRPAGRRHRVVEGGHPRILHSDAALIDAGQSILMNSYVPPSLLVGEQRELIHVFGDAQRFLRIPEGQVSLDIARLLPDKLVPIVTALLHKVSKDNIMLRSDAVDVEIPGSGVERVRLVIRPLRDEKLPEANLLLTFEVLGSAENGAGPALETLNVAAEASERVQFLERELSLTRDSLQATIEELETSNEELQATNEELMASNEELQSTNEELQSVNEELYTVNAEHQEKIEILNRLNADLDNMTKAASIPTVFLDEEMRLTRFTPEAMQLFKIREGDLGRPIDDFANVLDYPELFNDIKRVLAHGEAVEREVRSTAANIWYLARILPYVDYPLRSQRVVLTFVDVSVLKDIRHLQAILDSLPEHIAVVENSGRIAMVNKAWRDFAINNGDRELNATGPGVNYLEACRGRLYDEETGKRACEGLKAILEGRKERFALTYPCHSPREKRWFLMHAAPLRQAEIGAVVSHIDISEWMESRCPSPEAFS